MQRNHLIAIVAAIALAGIGSYAACGMEVSDNADELGVTVPDAPPVGEAPPMHMADAGPSTDFEQPSMDVPAPSAQLPESAPEAAMDANCGMQECDEGEFCCRVDGNCYPTTCQDCCPAMHEEPLPEVDLHPEPGDPAGPPPEPGVTPPGTPPAPPPGPGPGPMPPGE
jgi:hypothetical protein